MLYTNGCSLTYGMELGTTGYKLHRDELTDYENFYREAHNWPGILGKKMSMSILNDAISGASNDRIYRTTIDTIEGLSRLPDFAIIGWTSLGRMEVFDLETSKETQITFRIDGQKSLRKYNRITPSVAKFTDFYIEHFLDYEWLARKLVTQIIGLSSYLKHKGIPYLMFSGIANKMGSRGFDSYLPDDFYSSVSGKFSIGEFLHPLEDGHAYWADRLYTAVLDK